MRRALSALSTAMLFGTTLLAPVHAQRATTAAPAPPPQIAALKNLSWRSIGPANMGGRVTAIHGVPGDPKTFYVGGADGGIWKTTNGGITFTGIFENQPTYSIGAITLAPSDPNVIWVGTGEGDPRNSASFGDGVYRSTDGGETWTQLGLADSEKIKRIVVDPRNPDVAYVCALGHEWGGNEERGVFHTTDAGKTWKKVLYIDRMTGCSDIAMDAENPRILYAGMYTFLRKPWRFDSGAGQTAPYKSIDGGATWKKITNGLPNQPMDRIGLATSVSQPSVVYMVTEFKNAGILFRSDDRGETWRRVHDNPQVNFRPFYYSDIRVDPKNADRVYSLSGGLYRSDDGGRTFAAIGQGVHGDHQAFWIDPNDPARVLDGSDGGYQVSYDYGRTWEIINNVVLSQYYHVFFDLQQPYNICGGLQDNGNWCGPSRTPRNGILKDDWYTVSGGDGFYAVPNPAEPWLIYSNSQGGNIVITDIRSGNTRSIHPYPRRVGSAGDGIAEHKYRFNWDSPIHISPHDPKIVYFGGNVLFRSTDYGHSWSEISADLTTNDKSKQQSSGGEVVVDNTAAEFHSTIMSIAESPVKAGVIWVGTDDGYVQVTQDGGRTWANVTTNIKGLPANTWIARVEASYKEECTAYIAPDRHRDDDFRPYAYITQDCGKTWASIANGLPTKGYVQVVREDPTDANLLYLGTELGIFVSWDRGKSWASLRNNLPAVSVRDIRIHPREHDLIVGTHGRGIFILDDITPIRRVAAALNSAAQLFEPRPTVRWQNWNRDANRGSKTFVAENPPNGALFYYYVKSAPPQSITFTISDAGGRVIRTLQQAGARAGVNRAVWDLRHDGPAGAPEGGGGGRGGGAAPWAVPGQYAVTMRVAGQDSRAALRVVADPRIQIAQADYEAQTQAALDLRDLMAQTNRSVARVDAVRSQLQQLEAALRTAEQTGAVKAAEGSPSLADALTTVRDGLKKIADLRDEKMARPIQGLGYRQYPRIREELQSLAGQINGAAAAPTRAQLLRLGEIKGETTQILQEVDAVINTVIQNVNARIAGKPFIIIT
ncbi:MAG: VPS10 domain-containing protein [Longimicrobiales bacterium]